MAVWIVERGFEIFLTPFVTLTMRAEFSAGTLPRLTNWSLTTYLSAEWGPSEFRLC